MALSAHCAILELNASSQVDHCRIQMNHRGEQRFAATR